MPLDEEAQEQVKSLINNTINGAIASLKKQGDLARQKDTESLKESFGKLLEEKLSGLKGGGGDEPGEGGKGNKKDLQISTLQKRIDDAENAIRQANEKAANAERRRREIERQNMLDQYLAKGGVSDPFMREVAIAHFDRKGYVPDAEGEDAQPVWRGPDGVDVAFEEGMGAWFKSDEAKRFLPPTGAGGSGARRAPTRESAGGNPKKDVTYEDVGNAVLGLMSMPGLSRSSGE